MAAVIVPVWSVSPSENSLANFSGITNYEEYSLIQEVTEEKKEDGMGTLKKDRTLLLRDERKMEKLKAKLHTDDDCECKLEKVFWCVDAIFLLSH